MLRWLWNLWFRVKYRIRYQGVKSVSGHTPVLIIGSWQREIDPLLILLGLKSQVTALVPENRVPTPWIEKHLVRLKTLFLPPYSDKSRSFHVTRMMKKLESISLKGDLLVFPQGQKSPLLETILKSDPKRVIFVQVVENEVVFTPAPEDFPDKGSAEEMNRYVQEWFKLNGIETKKKTAIPHPEMEEMVLKELERLSGRSRLHISPEMHLYEDLGLDSLDVTEILVFLDHQFGQQPLFEGMRTVANVMQAAEGQIVARPKASEIEKGWLKAWNDIRERPPTFFPQGETIPELFLNSVDRMGSFLASADPKEVFSYTRVKTLVLGLIDTLRKFPGTHVGVLLPSTNYFNVMVLGLMVAKKVPALINWTLGPAHLEEVAKMADLQVILSTGPLLEWMPFDLPKNIIDKIVLVEELRSEFTVETRKKGIELARAKPSALMRMLNLDEMKPSDIAVLLFTSGTEKKPKGAPLSHANLLSNEKVAVKNIEMTAADVMLGILPPFHVFGFSITQMVPILTGCRALFHPMTLDFAAIASQIEKWGVTVVCTAPTFLRGLLALATKDQLKSVRLFIVGAEKAPDSLFDQVKALETGAQLLEGYGLTECSPVVSMNRLGAPRQGVGLPLDGVEVKIVNPDTKNDLPQGESGLILTRSPGVFSGYLSGNHPFIEDWFNTGDVGFLDSDGALHLKARFSRTIKVGGEMINLPVLEEELIKRIPKEMHAQIAIMGEEDAEGASHLVLYTTASLELDQVNHFLREAGFSNLLRVKEVHILNQLPLTATGKIDYKKLTSFLERS